MTSAPCRSETTTCTIPETMTCRDEALSPERMMLAPRLKERR